LNITCIMIVREIFYGFYRSKIPKSLTTHQLFRKVEQKVENRGVQGVTQ
jgi:hypothetical protein